MGFLNRLTGGMDRAPLARAAVIGRGSEAALLIDAYKKNERLELVSVDQEAGPAELLRTPGLVAVELCGEIKKQMETAAVCLKAGLFTSIDPPPDLEQLDGLIRLSNAGSARLRLRLLPLYYPPYREVKRLVEEDHLGRPICLKLAVRRGKGSEIPHDLDPAAWLAEKELGYLSLAQWLMGPIAKVHARLDRVRVNSEIASSVVMWKYENMYQYGYLQLDFCPGLHVRTFTEPVHRFLELTSVAGVIMVTRAEGQLLRMPVIMIRGKSTTTSLEMVPDDWRECYNNLARETASHILDKKPTMETTDIAAKALRLVNAARASREKKDEVAFNG